MPRAPLSTRHPREAGPWSLQASWILVALALLACGDGSESSEALPLMGSGEGVDVPPSDAPAPPAAADEFAVFTDPSSGFMTNEVFDADREVVHFDTTRGALVSAASGASVGGWTVAGADLDWSRSSVPFRVRFGTEDGQRRAYFTERGPGTICNLSVLGPDQLSISGTSQVPPNP